MTHDDLLNDFDDFDFNEDVDIIGDLSQSAYSKSKNSEILAPVLNNMSFIDTAELAFDEMNIFTDTRAEERAIAALKAEYNANLIQGRDHYFDSIVKLDPTYSPYDADLTGYENYIEMFKDAKSDEEVFYIKRLIDENQRTQNDIDNGSITASVIGTIGGIVVDPTIFIPFLGQARGATIAARMAHSTLKNTAVGTGVGVVREGIIQHNDPLRTAEDSAYGVLAEALVFGTLGGIAGAFAKNGKRALVDDMTRLMDDSDKVLDDNIIDVKLGDKYSNDPRSIGAQEANKITTITKTEEMDNYTLVNEGFIKNASISVGGSLATSASLATRKLVAMMTRTPYQTKGANKGIARQASAEEIQNGLDYMQETLINGKVRLWKEYKKTGDEQLKNYKEFATAVSSSMRRGNVEDAGINAHVRSAGVLQTKQMDILFEAGVKVGLFDKGMKVKFSAGYVNRLYNVDKIIANQPVFQGEIRILLNNSMREGDAKLVRLSKDDGQMVEPHIQRAIEIRNKQLAEEGDDILLDPSTFNYDDFLDSMVDSITDNIKGVKLSANHNNGNAIPSALKGRTLAFDDVFLEKWLISDSDDLYAVYHRTMVGNIVNRQIFGVSKTASAKTQSNLKKIEGSINKKDKQAIKNIHRKRKEAMKKEIAGERSTSLNRKDIAKLRAIEVKYNKAVSKKVIAAKVAKALQEKADNIAVDTLDENGQVIDEVFLTVKQREDAFIRVEDQIRAADMDAVLDTADGLTPVFKSNMVKIDQQFNQSLIDNKKVLDQNIEELIIKQQAASDVLEETGERSFEDYFLDIKQDYKELVAEGKLTQIKADKMMKKDIDNLSFVHRKVFKQLSDKDRGVVPGGKISRTLRVLKEISRMSKLGGVTISSIPDLARLITVNGFMPFAKLMIKFATDPSFRKLALKEKKQMAGAMEVLSDRRAKMYSGLDETDAGDTLFERAVSKGGDIFSVATLLPIWNQFTKGLTGVLAEGRLIDFADDIVAGRMGVADMKKFANWGIDQNTAKKIKDQYLKHGDASSGSMVANFEKWDDVNMAVKMKQFLSMVADDTIITPGAGDLPKFFTNEVVSTLFQFKSFAAASHDKIFLTAVSNFDKDTAVSLVMMAGLGTGVVYLKDLIADREVERSATDWLIDGVDRSGMFSLIAEANFWAGSLSQGRMSFGAMRGDALRRNQPMLAGGLGPAFGGTLDAGSVLIKGITGTDFSKSDVNKMTNILPFQNHFAFQGLMNNFVKKPLRETFD